MMGVAPEPKGPNPFKVGDLVEVVIAGYGGEKGDRFVVTNVEGRHVSWLPNGHGGGWWTRYKLVEGGTLRGSDEYAEALEAQEAYQAIVGS